MLVCAPAAATAAPPSNDQPRGAAPFQPYTAENGTPQEQEAFAELAEAGGDRGVPSCLGPGSFSRTVWFRVPAAENFQEITVEASGRTLALVDLAAFVQPEGATAPVTRLPNACSGAGSPGAESSEEPTSAVSLNVPPRRDVLIQVGRRGGRGSPDDERALLSLSIVPTFYAAGPDGDLAIPSAPRAGDNRVSNFALPGASITEEDPAEPACPALGTVWKRFVPRKTGDRLLSVYGVPVSTFTVYAGTRPTMSNSLDCVNRADYGPLRMRVPMRAKRTYWIRLGTDRPADSAEARLRIQPAERALVVNGGPGGFDPTTGGPGGGFPAACERADAARARVGGRRIRGSVKRRNRSTVIVLPIGVRGSPVCDVELALRGPRGRIYAVGRAVWLKGRRVVRLHRTRTLVRGVYRLEVSGLSRIGDRVPVRTRVRGRLVK